MDRSEFGEPSSSVDAMNDSVSSQTNEFNPGNSWDIDVVNKMVAHDDKTDVLAVIHEDDAGPVSAADKNDIAEPFFSPVDSVSDVALLETDSDLSDFQTNPTVIIDEEIPIAAFECQTIINSAFQYEKSSDLGVKLSRYMFPASKNTELSSLVDHCRTQRCHNGPFGNGPFG